MALVETSDRLWIASPSSNSMMPVAASPIALTAMARQSAYSELYFCEAYWPAFREIDFLRALRSYAVRKRRFGA